MEIKYLFYIYTFFIFPCLSKKQVPDLDRIRCLKIAKQYAPMWELLLRYFRCKSYIKSQPSVMEESVVTNIDIDGVKFEVSNESKRTNPLAQFQSIRWIAQMNKEETNVHG